MAKKCVLGLNEKIKNLDIWDIGLTKLTVFLLTLTLLTLFPAVSSFLLGINPLIYVELAVLAAIRPLKRLLNK